LVCFAFEHAEPGDLFVQKSPASTIETLAKAVQQLFGDTGTRLIGTRHGEKLDETLMTVEESFRAEDMGRYFRVHADSRDLNYERFTDEGASVNVVAFHGQAYTSGNAERLDVEGTVAKLLTADYVRHALEEGLAAASQGELR
jgi:UDP-glucose 4-epimerase